VLKRITPQAGVTLIELMVALVIAAILFGIALPSFRTWIQNTQVRTATESIQNGLQLARTEAVRLNADVQFGMDAGSGWTVQVVGGTVVQTRLSSDGSVNAAVAPSPAGATKVTFGGLGRVKANADATASLTQLSVTSTMLSAGETRQLNVTVGSGGVIKMCDPAYASGTPQACS
jgi:type IV fimbrial biogenesis protein FimT